MRGACVLAWNVRRLHACMQHEAAPEHHIDLSRVERRALVNCHDGLQTCQPHDMAPYHGGMKGGIAVLDWG